jgi:hypothetical protein
MSIKKPWVITKQDVKELLQIESIEYDNLIDRYLPIVSKDIEKITNKNFVIKKSGSLTTGSPIITDITTTNIDFDNVVSSRDFDNKKVIDFDEDAQTITLEFNAGSDLSETDVYINTFPLSKKPVAAQMVWWNIQKYNIDNSKLTEGQAISERWGSYNYSLADSEGKMVAGYPKYIVDGLNEIKLVRFF